MCMDSEALEGWINFYNHYIEENFICNFLDDRELSIKELKKINKTYKTNIQEIQLKYKGEYKDFLINYYKEEFENFKKFIKENERIYKKYQKLHEEWWERS